ncbi:MAG TPA: SMC family ATPase [Dehalococcoidia bacterium]|nr:SMC family ATPase [Dehalococcoidia bacterium]
MRPLTLEVEGFTAFKQRVCLDFSGLDLFAVTGPTGAGKSSLIDAICYALYGETPRMKDKVGACISPGLDRMQVTLDFLANGQRYRVLRETRRKGAGNTRLEQLAPDGWRPLSDRAREVTQMVERIVGLDYDAFTRSALLPQGQFQEFLAGSPENRRDVLRRLLRMEVYERMQRAAGQEAANLRSRIADIDARLGDELADATPENLKAQKQQLAATQAELQRLAVELVGLQQCIDMAKALEDAERDLAEHRAARDAAEAELRAAAAAVEGGEARLAGLRTQAESVKAELGSLPYDDQLFADLTLAANIALNLERATKAAAEAQHSIQTLEKAAEAAATAASRASEAAEAAGAELDAAETALREAERHDLAAALRAGLKPGDACPVCGGAIGELPKAKAPNLEAARRAVKEARARHEAARAAATKASTDAAVAANKAANARDLFANHSAQIEQAERELAAVLPAMEDRSVPAIQKALHAQKQARDRRALLQKQLAGLEDELSRVASGLDAARKQLVSLTARRDASTQAIEAAEQRVEALAAGLAEKLRLVLPEVEARGSLATLKQRHEENSRRQARLLTEQGSLQARIERLEADIERAKALREELAQCKAAYDVADDLARMLQANRFQAFVQAEALRSLAQDGSRKLLQLSAGRYELEVAPGGQDFLVKDKWNADDLRSVRTLSGGETFLASLALALSLAETLPGLAPGHRLALESIFLDEGFGSLDPEALSLAADALDALRGEDRLVCVVTHLPELAQRLPARVMVEKSESGSTISIA